MKDIFNTDFWTRRIRGAVQKHHSVYISPPNTWKQIEEAHKKIIGELVSGKVLDAGCGYGRMSEWVEDYTGVDFCEDFLIEAEKSYPHRRFEQSDLRDLSCFKDREFDWAICISIKRMVQDNAGKQAWLDMERELKRVAQHVLVLEYEDSGNYEVL